MPLNSGGRIRSYYTLKHLLPRHHLHVVELYRMGENVAPVEPELRYFSEVEAVHFPGLPAWSRHRLPQFLWPLTKNLLLSDRPFAIERYDSASLRERVCMLDQTGNYDLLVADGLASASAFEGWHQSRRTPAILFQHNVEAVIWERLATVHRNALARIYFANHARRIRVHEPQLCSLFNGVITISDEDASYHRTRYGLTNVLGRVPAGADVDPRGIPNEVRKVPDEPLIAFLGSMDWIPNQDAVVWFIHHVLPRIHNAMPGAKLLVIGRNPPSHILQIADQHPGIEFTGTVEEVSTHLRRCSLMVVPLRAGSGTRIKILEAMANGVPVVSTTVGAEGLPLRSHQDLILADDANGFASAVLRVLTEDKLRLDLAENGLNRIKTNFSWQQSAQRFEELAGSVLQPNGTSP